MFYYAINIIAVTFFFLFKLLQSARCISELAGRALNSHKFALNREIIFVWIINPNNCQRVCACVINILLLRIEFVENVNRNCFLSHTSIALRWILEFVDVLPSGFSHLSAPCSYFFSIERWWMKRHNIRYGCLFLNGYMH